MRLFDGYARFIALFVVAVLCLGGCVVGPNYRTPPTDMPPAWTEPAKGVNPGAPAALTRWWTAFNDSVLDSLIGKAVVANKDLNIAKARVREARAQRSVVAAGLYPAFNASALYAFSRGSANSPSATNPAPPSMSSFTGGHDLYQAGFDSSWELDIFGGTRRSVEAATADLSAAEENLRDVLVVLLADVSNTYMQLRGNQLRVEIAGKNIETQRKTLELTQARFEAGLSSDLDVSQAKAALSTTEASVPALEAAADQQIHQLGVLLGLAPGALVGELSVQVPIPPAPPDVPAGIPSDLLRRRPDVRQAERQLAAATARIGVATADLFPKFSLTGVLGQQSVGLSDFARSASTFWGIGPTVSWPIFQGGKIVANIEVQNARQEQALVSYQKIVLVSLQDVEDALVAYSKEQATRQSLTDAVAAAARADEISRELYARGLVDFLNVLINDRALYNLQDQLAVSTQKVSTDLVALYKALGGGWE
jgi:outer membrane protein, multidrug efflux system